MPGGADTASTVLDARASAGRRRVGPYQIETVLGKGAMGLVCRAVAPDGRHVALKMMLDAVLGTEEVVQRFEREARVRIRHPNVVAVLDAGATEEGVPYIAFELLEGETLSDRLKRGRMSAAEVVDLGVQLCHGLEAAHSAGIVHRDLKPANIFLCRDGTVKIVDFGVAFAQQHDSRLTSLGAVVGTPAYLSPEQASGATDVDGRSDLWSVGVVLYEALTGETPFLRDTPLATIVAVVTDEPPPLGPEHPPALANVIDHALRKLRDLRVSSPAILAAELQQADLSGTASAGRVTLAQAMPEENRVVAVLLAVGVEDGAGLEAAVVAEGGVLLHLLGQRALGVFGGQTWVGDESKRAVRAALEARSAARHVAVASGRARRSDAGITGAALSAAEMGCSARLDGVAVDTDTARGLGPELGVRPGPPGFVEVAAGSAGLVRGDDPPVVPLVGRMPELARLTESIRTVLDLARPLVLSISGPPGIGKTRIRMELARLLGASAEPFAVLLARGEPHRRDQAFSLLTAALRARATGLGLAATWRDLSSAEARRAALRNMVDEAVEDPEAARECAAFLGELCGVAMPMVPALEAARRDPQLMSDRLRVALRDYFDALAAKGPLALIVEDLQWADDASLEVVQDLLDRLADRPVLLAVTARTELDVARRDWLSGLEVVNMELRGLPPSEVGQLAQSVAGRPLSPDLVRVVADRTAGNPLFVEEIVLELRDRGDDDRSADLPLPLTVEAAVQSRLDGLPIAEKEVCKRGAVLGRPFTSEELEAMDVPGAGVLLDSLVKRELLAARARPRGPRAFQFRSALVSEVAVRMLTDELRESLHRRAARVLARGPDADPEELAVHHERGQEPADAALRYVEATRAASRRIDGPTVLRCSERALTLGAPPATRYELHMARHDVFRYLGRGDECDREVTAALEHAATDPERSRAHVARSSLLVASGRHQEALDAVGEAVLLARRGGDAETLVRALAHLGYTRLQAGDATAAQSTLEEALALSTELPPATRAMAVDRHAQVFAATGDQWRRLGAFREAEELYRLAGDIRRAAGAKCNLADAHNRFGAWPEAESELRAALRDCRRVGNRVMEGYALLNLGYTLAMAGRGDEALGVLDEAAEAAVESSDRRLALAVEVYRARVEASGDAASLETVGQQAEELGMTAIHASALVLASRMRQSAGDVAGALRAATKALELRDSHGGLEEDEAEVFLAAADALASSCRHADATAVLARGRARLEQVAAAIADDAARARFLALPVHARLMAA